MSAVLFPSWLPATIGGLSTLMLVYFCAVLWYQYQHLARLKRIEDKLDGLKVKP